MEGYRYQQFAYLIIPLIAGIEFFRNARFLRNQAGQGIGPSGHPGCVRLQLHRIHPGDLPLHDLRPRIQAFSAA